MWAREHFHPSAILSLWKKCQVYIRSSFSAKIWAGESSPCFYSEEKYVAITQTVLEVTIPPPTPLANEKTKLCSPYVLSHETQGIFGISSL